jgi:hypothetical protein
MEQNLVAMVKEQNNLVTSMNLSLPRTMKKITINSLWQISEPHLNQNA